MNDKTNFLDRVKANFKQASQSIIKIQALRWMYALTLLTGIILGGFFF